MKRKWISHLGPLRGFQENNGPGPGKCVIEFLLCLLIMGCGGPVNAEGLKRIKYNKPGLVVDLGSGLWAWPVPMDYDNDGDNDCSLFVMINRLDAPTFLKIRRGCQDAGLPPAGYSR
jgi:hypothetical protein